MLRGSLELNAGLKTGPLRWTAIGRFDREVLTSYEKDLQDMARRFTPGGPGSSLLSQYNQNELREFYVDSDIGDRVHVRLGKQQIVWGETDFFHPTDLIQGYDYRWRTFVEPESDEVRKPLIIANAKVSVPEVDGDLQLVLRPGLDRKRDIGNSYDLYGGRWAAQPFKGIDFLAGATRYDYDHPYGKANSPTGGARWTGLAGPVNYAFSYLRTFAPDPVLNPTANPIGKTPSGALGDFFFPTINVFDASVSGEIPVTGTVANLEVAYQPSRYFNTGTGLPNGTQGTGPVVRKDVITTTIRLDQKLRLESLLGTNAPSLFSLQMFDTWIQHFKSSDDIVAQVGWSAPAKRHDTLVTAFLTLNYMSSRLNPQLAGGVDVSTGDAFVIPSIEYQLGNHWRFLAEADLFFPKHSRGNPAQLGQSTYVLADFANNSQLMLRATYQF
ncbi:LysR family transcriptional regulator [Paraburkholderia sp. 5N]|uniref:LysR family transcriptional regulator n=2 Tax=Paraburkholderia elongata TaxID=2675747 RepID=A0A972SJ12_9BURK|nr:LysR family transcriptional regulator [Paraburkholderia elongata]